MALDPNIALGFRPVQLEQRNPLQEYAQIQNIQNAQLQNQLARQQMEQEQGAVNYLGTANLSTPEGRAGLRQFGKTGLGYEKLISEQETNALKQKELAGKVREQQMTALGTGLTSALKDPSDANLTAAFDRLDATGIDTKPYRASLLGEPDPAQRRATITQYVTANPEGRQAYAFVQPMPEQVKRADGSIAFFDKNPNSVTFGKEVMPGQAAGMTPYEKEHLNVTKRQANVAEQRLAWEKANPGYEIKEGEDGTMYGVNKRTLQATPINVAGAAPAAAGGAVAPVAGAVPVAGAAPVAGVPLKGKGTALTESQGNATAYGMRMVEANKLLKDLESSGTTSGGRIKGAIEGTLNALVPYQGEKLAEGAGAIMNVMPGVLGGPNAPQQEYDQAKRNFVTAVLRKESGASISPSEFANEEKKYFPQAGDTASVIKQKQKARELAVDAMKIQAGPGAKNIPGGAAADPLGIR